MDREFYKTIVGFLFFKRHNIKNNNNRQKEIFKINILNSVKTLKMRFSNLFRIDFIKKGEQRLKIEIYIKIFNV